MKQYLWMAILLISILFISACSKNDVYSKLSREEVDAFISDNKINAISVDHTENFSVIIFQNEDKYGHYVLYKDQNSKIFNKSVIATYTGNNKVLTGGVTTGKNPFVTIIINDQKLLKEADSIEVLFDDGSSIANQVTTKGLVLFYSNKTDDEEISYTKILIYDKDANLLYEE